MEIIMAMAKVTWSTIVMIVQNPLLLTFAILGLVKARLSKHR